MNTRQKAASFMTKVLGAGAFTAILLGGPKPLQKDANAFMFDVRICVPDRNPKKLFRTEKGPVHEEILGGKKKLVREVCDIVPSNCFMQLIEGPILDMGSSVASVCHDEVVTKKMLAAEKKALKHEKAKLKAKLKKLEAKVKDSPSQEIDVKALRISFEIADLKRELAKLDNPSR